MATQQQVAHYQGLAQQAERIGIAAGHRARQIVEQRMQAARIAGLTWGDVACAIRALGMPEASEDFTRVCYQCDDQMPKTEEDCVEFGRSSESAKMLIAAMDAIAKAEGR